MRRARVGTTSRTVKFKVTLTRDAITEAIDPDNSYYTVALFPNATLGSSTRNFVINESTTYQRL